MSKYLYQHPPKKQTNFTYPYRNLMWQVIIGYTEDPGSSNTGHVPNRRGVNYFYQEHRTKDYGSLPEDKEKKYSLSWLLLLHSQPTVF